MCLLYVCAHCSLKGKKSTVLFLIYGTKISKPTHHKETVVKKMYTLTVRKQCIFYSLLSQSPGLSHIA